MYQAVIVEYGISQTLMIVDLVKLGLSLYVALYQTYWEMSFQYKLNQVFWGYLFTVSGICDMTIGGMGCFICLVRYVLFGFLQESTLNHRKQLAAEYSGVVDQSYIFHQHTLFEGIMFACVICRLTMFARMNRNVFILWTTLSTSLRTYIQYALVFVPLIYGVVAIAHNVWGAYEEGYMSHWASLISIVMALFGDATAIKRTGVNHPWTFLFESLFYVCGILVFTNTWIAVVVQTYQRTRVAAGYRPKDYDWTEYDYVQKFMYAPFKNFYLNHLRKNIKKPPLFLMTMSRRLAHHQAVNSEGQCSNKARDN